ncbi:MAG: APC family permease [Alphaproteobacteria bacterium]|nr:APC family permease [Alphaproteobacteria bacterium]
MRFRALSIAAEEPARHGLLHILGVGFGVAVGIGMMIGSGILRSPSSIAAGVPSVEWIVALWVLGAVHAALGANIYAELATAIPKAGGGYVYVHRALGDIGGLIVGWSNWLSDLAGVAAASASFANFLAQLWPGLADYGIAIAVGMQLVLYGANLLGLREGRVLQQSTSLVKALLLLVFIVAAVAIAGEMPAAHVASAATPAIGWLALIGAYQLIRGAYAGWEAPVYFAEENAQPAKAIPRALGIGLLLTALLYIGVNVALLAALGVAGTARSVLPFTTVLMHFGGNVPSVLFAFGAMITVASCANANMMGAPRILFALGRDGLLPRAFTRVNAGGSPTVAFLMTAVGSIVLAASGSFETVFGLIGTLNSLAGILIGVTIFVLRAREPELKRPFRAIGYPVFPALVLAADAVLLVLFLWHQLQGGDLKGAIAAVVLSLACIPFALIARFAKGAPS